MHFPKPDYIRHDDLKLALYEAGPKDGLPLILVHGWPEMAYSWKNQMEPLANAGYRVIAFDMRGFGRSSTPKDKVHYGIANLVSDLEAILDDRGIEKAVIVGHDWGGIVVWHAARMISQRITGVISICTPHVKPAPVDPIKIFRQRYGDEHYFVHFYDNPGQADALFMQDPKSFFRMMFRRTVAGATLTAGMSHIPKRFANYLENGAPKLGHEVMSDTDLKAYADLYSRSGFHGGLNLYRNTTANWELGQGLSDTIPQPVLMISARQDLFLPPETTEQMVDMVPDLERHIIEDCGHWTMWEKPEALNALMLDWLGRRY